jgi:hypothetical protein
MAGTGPKNMIPRRIGRLLAATVVAADSSTASSSPTMARMASKTTSHACVALGNADRNTVSEHTTSPAETATAVPARNFNSCPSRAKNYLEPPLTSTVGRNGDELSESLALIRCLVNFTAAASSHESENQRG